MKVYAIPEPERQTVRVYVEVGGATDDGARHFRTTSADGVPTVTKVPPGAEPPMFMRLEMDVAVAVADALTSRPEASARHLDDALTVRDRLLALIEKRWEA